MPNRHFSRRWLSIFLLALTTGLALPGAADASPPNFAKAQAVARHFWHANPCHGKVTVEWGSYDASTNAMSWWDNPKSPNSLWKYPAFNTNCEVYFNRAKQWDWPKLCSVMVHEFGHLLGHKHSDDPADLMFPIYRGPIAVCQESCNGRSGCNRPGCADLRLGKRRAVVSRVLTHASARCTRLKHESAQGSFMVCRYAVRDPQAHPHDRGSRRRHELDARGPHLRRRRATTRMQRVLEERHRRC